MAKRDLYHEVTESIIALMEAGKTSSHDWKKGMTSRGLPMNYKTRQSYSGVNVLLLWNAACAQGYRSNYWLTFNQAKELGGHVREQAKGVLCVFFKNIEKKPAADADTPELIPVISPFWLFNIDQIEGIDFTEVFDSTEPAPGWSRIDQAEAILYADGVKILEQGSRAFYRPASDEIYLPDHWRFEEATQFYAVGFHEKIHWTGAKHRLAREFGKRFGDDAYAFEELIAELGAAFLCADVGMAPHTMSDHAGYIDSWLTVLKRDKRAIFTAAAKASEAHRFIMAAYLAGQAEQAA